jgi:hypothetical protein
MVKLPTWLYESLPYIYAGAGAVALWRLDDVIGEISGLLLISAGLVVANMRHEYRKILKARMGARRPGP